VLIVFTLAYHSYIFYDALGVLISHGAFLIVTFRGKDVAMDMILATVAHQFSPSGSYAKVGCVSDVQNALGDKWLCTLMHWFLYIGRTVMEVVFLTERSLL